jgi:hypothetical protein
MDARILQAARTHTKVRGIGQTGRWTAKPKKSKKYKKERKNFFDFTGFEVKKSAWQAARAYTKVRGIGQTG